MMRLILLVLLVVGCQKVDESEAALPKCRIAIKGRYVDRDIMRCETEEVLCFALSSSGGISCFLK